MKWKKKGFQTRIWNLLGHLRVSRLFKENSLRSNVDIKLNVVDWVLNTPLVFIIAKKKKKKTFKETNKR